MGLIILTYEETLDELGEHMDEHEDYFGAEVEIADDAEVPEGFLLPEKKEGVVVGYSGDFEDHFVVRVEGKLYVIEVSGLLIKSLSI